jgi:DNA-binding transcriptional MocR family regulator
MKKEVLYQEIARNIAWQIKKGVWKIGEKLPSLRTISNENGVSLNTAIQAYYELEKDGYIISRPKSGYIVSYKPIRLSVPATPPPARSVGKEEEGLITVDANGDSDISVEDFAVAMVDELEQEKHHKERFTIGY